LEIDEEVENLRSNRDVERRDGLVANDESRLERQRPGDHDSLALATGDLVRIAAGVLRPEPYLREESINPLLKRPSGRDTPDDERLSNRRAYRGSRIKR
jgi:hypothetical protein